MQGRWTTAALPSARAARAGTRAAETAEMGDQDVMEQGDSTYCKQRDVIRHHANMQCFALCQERRGRRGREETWQCRIM